MGALLHRRIARPRSSGPRRSNAGRYCDEARLTLLLATLCAAPACALAEEPDPGLELGVDSFGVELTRAHAPNAMDSSIPALRAAAIFQGESGIAFKQTLIYGSGKSIQGRAWQADTRLGYRSHLTEHFIFEPLISLGMISVTPNYHMENESNVKTKYILAGARMQLETPAIGLAVDGQAGRNISPSISNVICTPGLSYSVGVEAYARYFTGKLVVGAERKRMPMGSGYRFAVSHIYAGYRLEF